VLITQALCGLFCFWSVRFKSWAMLTPVRLHYSFIVVNDLCSPNRCI
jgi:hypothetical protein